LKKIILITAYAVNPYKGSEDNTGWNISKEIAKKYQTIIVTRKNNREEIERYFSNNKDTELKNMSFIYHDLPQWAMSLKKKLGERGYVLYFYFWQMLLPMFVKRCKVNFDLSYALNFHSDSTPHFLWLLGKPVIWGPIGHHPKIPSAYLKHHSLKVQFTDIVYGLVKWMMRNLDPFFYIAKKRTSKIIAINSSVRKVLNISSSKITVIPAVASKPVKQDVKKQNKFNVLSVGRFHAMKGFDITVLAFAKFYKSLPNSVRSEVKLKLVGGGDRLEDLKNLISEHNITSAVDIIPWVQKSEMDLIYRDASVFLFPSHEGAGMVVPEALSYGLPIICFDNVGPGELLGNAGIKCPYSSYDESVRFFSQQLNRIYNDPKWAIGIGLCALKRFNEALTWTKKGNAIRSVISDVLEETNTIAVFHPSAELYGADRILVNGLKAIPDNINKRVYLFRDGDLVDLIKSTVSNVEVIIKPDMPVICRKMFSPIGILIFLKNWIWFFPFFLFENRKHHFTSVYLNTLSVSLILPIVAVFNIKRFIHVHEIIENPKVAGKLTAWLSYKFADKIVCVSNAVLFGLKNYIINIERKAEVIYNGIDAIEVVADKSKKELKFYLFGRIKPDKGQWFLIQALSLIPIEKLTNVKFVLMGGILPGQNQILEDLKARIVAAGLSDVIQIKDFSTSIVNALSDADVCLIPSIMKDPFPTTVLEAMSAGKTVIATNNGGAKEAVINNETGFLVEPNNSREFADRLVYIINHKTELPRWGTNAKNRYLGLFTFEVFKANWENFNLSNKFY
tara:strand:- start:2146 stop:4512 length:2367 start_codon:yes stop_codon:yes gene_type:complete